MSSILSILTRHTPFATRVRVSRRIQPPPCARVRAPVDRGILKWVYGDISQDVCPWNVKFARELPAGSPFAPREFLVGKDAATLSRDILALTQEEFSAAFKGSPMKRAKRRGLARNAAVALGNLGTMADMPAPEAALQHDEPLVREHAAWALVRLRTR